MDDELIRKLVDAHLVRGEFRGGKQWYELSHDRLIAPVRASNRAWFDKLHKVQKVASAWESQGRPEGLLLLGADLEEAQRWARTQASLTGTERRFLKESEKAQAARDRDRLQAPRLLRLSIGLGMVGVLALGAFGWALNSSKRANAEAGRADSRRLAVLAGQSMEDRPDVALLLALEAWSRSPAAEAEPALAGIVESIGLRETLSLGAPANTVAFSPDGKWLAAGLRNGKVVLVPQQGGRTETIGTGKEPVARVEFSANGEVLAWTDQRGGIVYYRNLKRGASGELKTQPARALFALNADGSRVALGNGPLQLWDVASGKELPLKGPRPVTGVVFVNESLLFQPFIAAALSDYPGGLGAWDAESGKMLEEMHETYDRNRVERVSFEQPLSLLAVVCSPQNDICATGSKTGEVIVWRRLESAGVLAGGFSDAGGGRGRRGQSRDMSHFGEEVMALAFDPTGDWLATGGIPSSKGLERPAQVLIWDTAGWEDEVRATRRFPSPGVLGLSFSPDGSTLAGATVSTAGTRSDWSVVLWDLAPPSKAVYTAAAGERGLSAQAVSSASGKAQLAFAVPGGPTKVWREGILTATNLAAPAHALAFSPDGSFLASVDGNAARRPRLWDLKGREIEMRNATFPVQSIALSSGAERMALIDDRKQVLLTAARDLKDGHRLSVTEAEQAAFSLDGSRLAIAEKSQKYGRIGVWDVKSARLLRTLDYSPTAAVAVSPDGRHVAAAGDYNEQPMILLWNAETGSLLRTIQIPKAKERAVRSLAFNSDGSLLAAQADGFVRVWTDLSVEPWRTRACRVVRRNFCPAEWTEYMGAREWEPTCPEFGRPAKALCE